jgi:hypothetical protein
MRPPLPGIAILIIILPLFLTAATYRAHPIFCLPSVIIIVGDIIGGFTRTPPAYKKQACLGKPSNEIGAETASDQKA